MYFELAAQEGNAISYNLVFENAEEGCLDKKSLASFFNSVEQHFTQQLDDKYEIRHINSCFVIRALGDVAPGLMADDIENKLENVVNLSRKSLAKLRESMSIDSWGNSDDQSEEAWRGIPDDECLAEDKPEHIEQWKHLKQQQQKYHTEKTHAEQAKLLVREIWWNDYLNENKLENLSGFKRLECESKWLTDLRSKVGNLGNTINPKDLLQDIDARLASIERARESYPEQVEIGYKIADIEKVIQQLIKENDNLSVLTIKTDCSNKHFRSLMQALKNHPSLQTLIFDGFWIQLGNNEVGLLAEMLEANRSIAQLYLSGMRLNDSRISVIAKALEKSQSVKLLDLSNNLVTDEGAKVLATMIRANHRLQELNVSNTFEGWRLKDLNPILIEAANARPGFKITLFNGERFQSKPAALQDKADEKPIPKIANSPFIALPSPSSSNVVASALAAKDPTKEIAPPGGPVVPSAP